MLKVKCTHLQCLLSITYMQFIKMYKEKEDLKGNHTDQALIAITGATCTADNIIQHYSSFQYVYMQLWYSSFQNVIMEENQRHICQYSTNSNLTLCFCFCLNTSATKEVILKVQVFLLMNVILNPGLSVTELAENGPLSFQNDDRE